jgi:hypothetical protein
MGEYRFFHRDFFAFGKEVSSGIWLRLEAALGRINALFHRQEKYCWTSELSNTRVLDLGYFPTKIPNAA